jgi:hypothetical protein
MAINGQALSPAGVRVQPSHPTPSYPGWWPAGRWAGAGTERTERTGPRYTRGLKPPRSGADHYRDGTSGGDGTRPTGAAGRFRQWGGLSPGRPPLAFQARRALCDSICSIFWRTAATRSRVISRSMPAPLCGVLRARGGLRSPPTGSATACAVPAATARRRCSCGVSTVAGSQQHRPAV